MCLFAGVEDGATAAGADEGRKTRAIISRMMTAFMAGCVRQTRTRRWEARAEERGLSVSP